MTTYERLTLAIDQMQTRGRCVGGYRSGGINGSVCLVGSLLRDEEMEVDAEGVCQVAVSDLLRGGPVIEAVKLMGFEHWVDAFRWNDGMRPRNERPTDAEVLARLEAARDRILHMEADKGAVAVENEIGVCA